VTEWGAHGKSRRKKNLIVMARWSEAA
jgi:hypothetical protein